MIICVFVCVRACVRHTVRMCLYKIYLKWVYDEYYFKIQKHF